MKITKLFTFLFFVLTLFVITSCDKDNKDNSPINVIMVNDNHGVLNEEDGSLDKIATGIESYKDLGNVVKIANGDMFQGTYISSSLRGLPMLDALNELEFDCFVLGNHEFDWGLDEMKKYKDGDKSNGEADFPFLGANIIDKSTGKMVDWLEPYHIVKFGDIKIGIIGIIGEVEDSILRTHVQNYDFVEPRSIVKNLASELREEKDCDVVIVAIHGDDDELNDDIARFTNSNKIDGIFNGHSHIPTDEVKVRSDGTKVCVLQNGGYGDSFANLTLEFDDSKNLTNTDGQINDTDDYKSKGILSSVFNKYKDEIAIGDQVVFTCDQNISKYEVGIEIAHSMYMTYACDFAVINTGGVRASINKGDVTYADLFQILPFENEVYIVTINGKDLKKFVANSAIYYWGIYLDSIKDDQDYLLAIVDYVYQSYIFDDYRTGEYVDTNDLIRDIFINYIKNNI